LLQGADGEPVDVSSRHNSIPRSLRRMVTVRDHGRCRFPGCSEARYTEIHHLRHREHQGENTAGNLATLCWFHHRLVHEGGWSLARDVLTGEYVATNPAGLPLRGAAGDLAGNESALRLANEVDGHPIDPTTTIPRWAGESLDLGWAVTSLWYSNHPAELAAHAAQAARCRAAAV
jgi:hypothetical protein